MSKIENNGWTEKGALSVLAAAPVPGGDMVFAPPYETVKSAIEFLDSLENSKRPSGKPDELETKQVE